MGFLNPFLLFGLAAISIPIIIHLLNRRKFRKVVWAAMRFLKVSVDQNQRRMQVEDFILLALRCLILALLALALARPVMRMAQSDPFGQSKVSAVIVLDNSLSMGATDGVETRFDEARKAAKQALDALPPGSATALLLASDVVLPLIQEPTHDLAQARIAVESATLSDHGTDLLPAVKAAIETLKGRAALRKEVFIITDDQAVGWRQLAQIEQTLRDNKEEIKGHIIVVGRRVDRNLSISGLSPAGGLTPINQSLRFDVQVANQGADEHKDVRIQLQVGNEAPSDEITLPSIAPGTTTSVTLFTKLRADGFHAVTARILGGDRLPADDRRTVVVRALREVRVLLVNGEPGKEPRDDETFFLEHALAPVSQSERENYFIKTTTVVAEELPNLSLLGYDVVALANVRELTGALMTNFVTFVRQGGGLMVFPGSKLNNAFYNEQMVAEHALLPATYQEPEGLENQEAVFFQLQSKGYKHSVVELWNNPDIGTLSTARFFRRTPVSLAATGTEKKDAGAVRVVLEYADGKPAVLERDFGLGRVIQFTSTADVSWSDMPVRPVVVPLMHRLLGWLVQRQDEELNLRVGNSFVRRLPADLSDLPFKLSAPNRPAGATESGRVAMVEGVAQLQYGGTHTAGLYEVALEGHPLRFAAQPDPRESNLDPLAPEQWAKLKAVAKVFTASPELQLRAELEKSRVGAEWWLPLALAVLMLAGLETWLAQKFSRPK